MSSTRSDRSALLPLTYFSFLPCHLSSSRTSRPGPSPHHANKRFQVLSKLSIKDSTATLVVEKIEINYYYHRPWGSDIECLSSGSVLALSSLKPLEFAC